MYILESDVRDWDYEYVTGFKLFWNLNVEMLPLNLESNERLISWFDFYFSLRKEEKLHIHSVVEKLKVSWINDVSALA